MGGTNCEDAPSDTEVEETEVDGEIGDPNRVLDSSQGPPVTPEPPQRRGGRRSTATTTSAPRRVAAVATIPSVRENDHPSNVQSREIVDRWPAVIQWLQKRFNLGPEAVKITVNAVSTGPYQGSVPVENVGSIPGECVAGDSQRSPDEALRDWVIDVFHAIRRGATNYDLRFYFKTLPIGVNHSQICTADLFLGPPELVAAQRRAAVAAFERSKSGGNVVMPSPVMSSFGGPPGAAPMGLLPPAPTSSGSSGNEEIVQEILRRLLSGQPLGVAPTVPVVPSPPPVTIDQELERLAKLKKLFDAPPPPPPPPPPKVPTMEEQFENVARMMKAMQSLMPQAERAVQVATTTKPMTAMENVKEVVGFLKQMDEVKGALGLGAADDKPEVPDEVDPPFNVYNVPGTDVQWPHGEGLSTAEQAKQFLALNPELSFRILGKVTEIVDHTTIGQFFRHMMERANPQQQAVVRQVAEAKGIGMGTAPTPTTLNGSSPPAPATIPTPPPSEWRPPV
jgi:hypothetical protein